MKNLKFLISFYTAFLLLNTLGVSSKVYATGVFNIPHFINPGEFSIGVEPELDFTGGAAVGANFRYSQGINDLSNLTGIIGTGGGVRGFRVGAAYTFDFFPDIEKQPGIGIALQPLFVQLPNAGSLEITAIPYIHKSVKMTQGDIQNIEPFMSIPLGLSLSGGAYQSLVSVVVGSLFQHSEHIRSVVEFGVNLNNAYTYFSGGVVYYH